MRRRRGLRVTREHKITYSGAELGSERSREAGDGEPAVVLAGATQLVRIKIVSLVQRERDWKREQTDTRRRRVPCQLVGARARTIMSAEREIILTVGIGGPKYSRNSKKAAGFVWPKREKREHNGCD